LKTGVTSAWRADDTMR